MLKRDKEEARNAAAKKTAPAVSSLLNFKEGWSLFSTGVVLRSTLEVHSHKIMSGRKLI
jgi:hypothetical protein